MCTTQILKRRFARPLNFKPIDLQRLKPSGWGKSGRRARPRFPQCARMVLPTRRELNAEKGWGAARQTPRDLGVLRLPSAFQQPGSGGRTQRGACGYNGETRQSRRLSRPRRTWTLGTRGLGLPSAANHPANSSNLRTALVLGAHGERGWPQAPMYPKCTKPGACLNGNLPGPPVVDKQHSVRRAGGSRPESSTRRAHPLGLFHPALTRTRRASMLAAGAQASACNGESGAATRAAVPPSSNSRSREAGGRDAQTRAGRGGALAGFPGAGLRSCKLW